jgi:hypothetical protein
MRAVASRERFDWIFRSDCENRISGKTVGYDLSSSPSVFRLPLSRGELAVNAY